VKALIGRWIGLEGGVVSKEKGKKRNELGTFKNLGGRRSELFYNNAMSLYRRIQLAVVVFLSAMLVLGLSALMRPPSYEIFPFYSWSMFALVPGEKDQFYAMVGNDGAWVEFTRAGGLVYQAQSVVAYNVIQKLGRAALENDSEGVANWRQQFEKNYLPPGTSFQIQHRRVDPLTRFQQERRGTGVPDGLTVVMEGQMAP
jgi:hypothetical protein